MKKTSITFLILYFLGSLLVVGLGEEAFASHGQEPTLRWRFDAGSTFAGTTAYDATGNGNNGALQGGMGSANWVQGKRGTALTFDGVDDYVACTDAACGGTNKLDFSARDDFSFGAWFKTGTAHTGTILSKKSHGGPTEPGYLIRTLGSPDRIQCLVSDGAAHVANAAVQFSYADNTWHYVVCAYKGSSAKTELYIDGQLQSAAPISNTSGSLDNAADFRAGTQGNSANPFQGLVDDVRVYRRALEGAEIARFLQSPPFQGIPQSPVAQKNIGQWTLIKNDTFAPGTDWSPLDETQVFHTRLKHTQGAANSFELRVGKGSQMYSLIAPWGETIAKQRANDAEWVDEVWQVIAVDRSQNNPPTARYFIHQAGAYKRDPIMTETFYSPILEESWDDAAKIYKTLIWPQQAHVPTSFRSGLLLEQRIRDIGDGILEITHLYYNFGNDTIDFLSHPWAIVRNSNLPVQFLSQPDGSYQRQQKTWPNTQVVDFADTGGWFAFANGDTSSSLGYGIVFGENKHVGSPFQWNGNKVRWGTLSANDPRDGAVWEVQGRVSIKPGENFLWRQFFVVNTMEKIREYGNELAEHVEYGPVIFSAASSPRIPLCEYTTPQGQKTLTKSCGGETTLFQTYQDRIPNSLPLFILRETTTNAIVISTDPYKLSAVPYDGKTAYDGFLGWALPTDPVMRYITDPRIDSLTIPRLFLDRLQKLVIKGSNFSSTQTFKFRLKQGSTIIFEKTITPTDSTTTEVDFPSSNVTALTPGFYTLELRRESDSVTVTHSKQFLVTKLGDLWSSTATASDPEPRDGKIDIHDVTRMLSTFGKAAGATGFNQEADINPGPGGVSTGKVDIFDANKLMANWTP